MNNLMTLEECGVEITGGQIMSRVALKKGTDEEITEKRKVVVPKCIHSDGSVNTNEMPTEQLKTASDEKKITKTGDIVVKLSTPYDSGKIDEASEECIVPSFCAIIKEFGELDPDYLLAFLNSEACKKQFRIMCPGTVMSVLSVGKILKVKIPVPDKERQRQIGGEFLTNQKRLRLVKEVAEFEAKRIDIVFKNMVKEYEQK